MKIRCISYGFKFFEAEGLAPPPHDFLFNLRDLPNPYWEEKLRAYKGTDKPVIEFFENSELAQERLNDLKQLCLDFTLDFLGNPSRKNEDSITFAFRCTGGKHRSVYFTECIYRYIKSQITDKMDEDLILDRDLEFEKEHLELHRYAEISG